jgi:predicted extracellular nuclease
MNKVLFFFQFLIAVFVINAQSTIAKWSFETSSLNPETGNGSITMIGGVVGPTYPGGNPAGLGMNITTFPLQSTLNKTAGIELSVPNDGYQSISVSFDRRNSNTASKKEVMLLSQDNGVSFIPVDSFMTTVGSAWLTRMVSVNLNAAQNPKNYIFRIVSAFDGSVYAATGSTSAYGAAGTWRFDNILVTATKKTSTKASLSATVSKTAILESDTNGAAMVVVSLSKIVDKNVSMKLNVSGTGIDTDDYYLIGGDSIKIDAGMLADTIFVKTKNDLKSEGTETMNLAFGYQDTAIVNNFVFNAKLDIMDDDMSITKISLVQGADTTSPLLATRVKVEGIVTFVSQGTGGFGGFYVQEEDQDADKSTATSEGVWVESTFAVNKGDKVQVEGLVAETYKQTRLTNTSVWVVSSNNTLPKPIELIYPVASFEPFEGMSLKIVSKLTVTENYNLGRYGELMVSFDGLLYTPSQLVDLNDSDPSNNTYTGNYNLAAVKNAQKNNAFRKLILDDASAVELPNPIPFLDKNKTVRVGSTIDTLYCVMSYDFGYYVLEPTAAVKINYDQRPVTVPSVGAEANIKVAAFNVENLFNGDNGSFAASRGATSMVEFKRQVAKISRAVAGIDADVIGLIELENDGFGPSSAIKELVDSVNLLNKNRGYKFIKAPSRLSNLAAKGMLGGDAIKVGLIYDSLTVYPEGDYMIFDDTLVFNRVPLAQKFNLKNTKNGLTVMVNHFKSKGCSGSTGLDADQADGQACFNARRKMQADSVMVFVNRIIAATGDSDVVVMGDINAYAQEDPMDLMKSKGMVNFAENDSVFSYVFSGEVGALDHALGTKAIYSQLTGAAKWHINSTEPVIIEYSFNDPASRKTKTTDPYEKSPFRCSDHDPIVLGFKLVNKIVTQNEDNLANQTLFVFPNPVTDILSVEIPTHLVGAELKVYSAAGTLVASQIADQKQFELNFKQMGQGVYLLKIEDVNYKVVKE